MGIVYWQVSHRDEKGRRKYSHFSTHIKALRHVDCLIKNGILPMGTASINIQLKSHQDTPPKKIDGYNYAYFINEIHGGE